ERVVVDKGGEAVESARRKARPRRSGQAQRSAWVPVSRQLGSRERTSRPKVQRSRWSATSVAEPSTTSPDLSRVTDASLAAKRTPTCAVGPVSCAAAILAPSIDTTVVVMVWPAAARARIAALKFAKA